MFITTLFKTHNVTAWYTRKDAAKIIRAARKTNDVYKNEAGDGYVID